MKKVTLGGERRFVKHEDYQENKDATLFIKRISEKLLLLLEEQTTIFMDNVSYHSQLNEINTSSNCLKTKTSNFISTLMQEIF